MGSKRSMEGLDLSSYFYRSIPIRLSMPTRTRESKETRWLGGWLMKKKESHVEEEIVPEEETDEDEEEDTEEDE